MPVYAYRCTECGVEFDKRQSFNDDPVTICPECEGEVYRVITPAGVIFKGSGFYVTDNKASKSKSASNGKSNGDKSDGNKSDGETSTKSEKKSEAKSESKSASKSESKKATSSKAD